MSNQRIRAYVWEIPVRLTHWLKVLCIIVFSITGFYIGAPFIHSIAGDTYIMGWMRFVHFVAAYVFVATIVVRLYWSFAGNKYANWKVFFPFTGKKIKQIKESVYFYLLIRRKTSYLLGHSAIAGLTYFTVYILFMVEIFTGFALYSLTHQGIIWTMLGGWLTSVISLQAIRLYHHLAMWVILTISMIHIYIALMVDSLEKNGLIGSIFGGYKFITKDYDI